MGSDVVVAVGSDVVVAVGVGIGSSEHPARSMNTAAMLMTRLPIMNLDIATSPGIVQTPPSKETSGIYDLIVCSQVEFQPVISLNWWSLFALTHGNTRASPPLW